MSYPAQHPDIFSLTNLFLEEESRTVVFSLESDKSLGPDRFAMIFFHRF